MQPPVKVLFVDDEAHVLEGLRLVLFKHRERYAPRFARGGVEAVSMLDAEPFDVVVTDLRMPKVDGVKVLEHAQEVHPRALRVVLSGDVARDAALRVLPIAHQCLAKPCRMPELEAVLARAGRLSELVSDPEVQDLLGRIRELPPLPRTYTRLMALLDDERAGPRDIAAVVASDIATSARILQLVNSAFFGVGRPVRSVEEAMQMLGIEFVKSLVLSTAVFVQRRVVPPVQRFAEELHGHSFAVAEVAAHLAAPSERRDAFTAGLLHDVGLMVLAVDAPSVVDIDAKPWAPRTASEERSHAAIGGYLLGLWGLPLEVIEAVSRHHAPPGTQALPVARAVALAETIVEELRGEALELTELRRVAGERAAAILGAAA